MKTLLWALAISFVSLTSGCGVIFSVSKPGDSEVVGARLDGPACEGVETRTQTDGVGWGTRDGRMVDVGGKITGAGPSPSADPATQILAVACVDYTGGGSTAARLHRLDPAKIDHFSVAVMLADCGRSIGCMGAVLPEDPGPHDKYLAGLMAWYVAHVDTAQVEVRVAEAGVPPAAASLFMAEVESTLTDVKKIAGALEAAEKSVYLDIPFDASEKLLQTRDEFAEHLAQVETLAGTAHEQRSSGVSDETIASLETLRRDHVEGCGAWSCMRDPVGHAIARELFLAHISRVDVLGAIAELPFLPEGKFADLVAKHQAEVMKKHHKAHELVQRGVKNGLDRDTALASANGVEPHAFEGAYPFDYEKMAAPWGKMVPSPPRGKVVEKTYRVKRKAIDGERTTLYFFDHVRKWDQEVCRDTGRIDRIESGRVRYKQRCRRTGKVETMRTKRDPIEVPTAEAKAIKTKDWVSVIALTGSTWTGRVARVKRGEDLPAIQIRAIRLK